MVEDLEGKEARNPTLRGTPCPKSNCSPRLISSLLSLDMNIPDSLHEHPRQFKIYLEVVEN